jgi:hypothetical protein
LEGFGCCERKIIGQADGSREKANRLIAALSGMVTRWTEAAQRTRGHR